MSQNFVKTIVTRLCHYLSDLSTSALGSALGSLQDQLSCQLCRNNLKERVKQIIVEWSNVKVGCL